MGFKPALLTLENASFPVRLGWGVVVCQGTDESFALLQLDTYGHASWAHLGDGCVHVSTRRPAGESVFPWADGTVFPWADGTVLVAARAELRAQSRPRADSAPLQGREGVQPAQQPG